MILFGFDMAKLTGRAKAAEDEEELFVELPLSSKALLLVMTTTALVIQRPGMKCLHLVACQKPFNNAMTCTISHWYGTCTFNQFHTLAVYEISGSFRGCTRGKDASINVEKSMHVWCCLFVSAGHLWSCACASLTVEKPTQASPVGLGWAGLGWGRVRMVDVLYYINVH